MSEIVSVIIPVYNRDKTIAECLDSVLAQSYTSFEVICIDDCSADRSLQILREYESTDPRIVVISLPVNHGVSYARNEGIKRSTGYWIAFVDSDDTIVPDMFRTMTEMGRQYRCDMVLSDLDMISHGIHRNLRIDLAPNRPYEKGAIRNDILPRFSYPGESNLSLFSFSTKLYRSALIKENRILFKPAVSWQEDKLFVIEAMARCERLCYSAQCFYQYRVGSDGLYTSFRSDSWKSSVYLWQSFMRLCETYQIPNVNTDAINEDFVYNITWFLYRSQRVPEGKLIQRTVLRDEGVQAICSSIVGSLSSFDRRMVKSIMTRNRRVAMLAVNFVYGGLKDRLVGAIGRMRH